VAIFPGLAGDIARAVSAPPPVLPLTQPDATAPSNVSTQPGD